GSAADSGGAGQLTVPPRSLARPRECRALASLGRDRRRHAHPQPRVAAARRAGVAAAVADAGGSPLRRAMRLVALQLAAARISTEAAGDEPGLAAGRVGSALLDHLPAAGRERAGGDALPRDPDGAGDVVPVLAHAVAAAVGPHLDAGRGDGSGVARIVATLRPPDRGGREHERGREKSLNRRTHGQPHSAGDRASQKLCLRLQSQACRRWGCSTSPTRPVNSSMLRLTPRKSITASKSGTGRRRARKVVKTSRGRITRARFRSTALTI